MKIIRRIRGNIDSKNKKFLIENALKVKLDSGYFHHDLDEKSEEYSNIKKLADSLGLDYSIIGTFFSKLEIEQADILVFKGIGPKGYPQPEDPIEFDRITYSNNCPECGIHDEQKAPFQMKEPRLGKDKMLQLNWKHDEIFVERNFYESFFKDFGIGMREAMLYKKNIPIKTVIQLNIPKAEFNLDMKGIEFSVCSVCHRIKYLPTINGFFPKPLNTNFDLIKTKEYFGSGHAAFNQILVSKKMMREMVKNKMAKFYNFYPAK